MSVIGWIVRVKDPYGEETVYRVGEPDRDKAEAIAKKVSGIRSARGLQTITAETLLDKPLKPGDCVRWL